MTRPFQPRRFRPAYMAGLDGFFKLLDEDGGTRAAFLAAPGQVMARCGLKDSPPGVTFYAHADSESLRTLVLPPPPPPPPQGAVTAGLGKRAQAAARESLCVVHLGRADVMLWVTLIEAHWSGRRPRDMSALDDIFFDAWRDETARKRFIDDPRRVLSAGGVQLSENMEIRIVEQTPAMVHIVLPPQGSHARFDFETFEEWASGWNWWRALDYEMSASQ